ncbi:MAG: Fe-S cluster biogenesis protein NfuA [Crocinitomicaceae bacterium]|jgi:Fe-S cluster biogenesis protein NfuA
MTMKVPVTVYAEMTPNPSTMKFVANKHILGTGDSAEFNSMAEAKGYSPLAAELFSFPFVQGVFIASNFVTITKTDNLSWDFITMELREFIRTWIFDDNEILVMMPPKNAPGTADEDEPKKEFAISEYDDAIRGLLDEFVRPAVENDGGAIDFRGFDNGVVTVVLRGSCAGCPSSTNTLKGGIESLLKQHLPEVTEVVAENG